MKFDLACVPAGEFWMGADPAGAEGDAYLGQPRHQVYLPEFCISRTPVTQAQYQFYVAAMAQGWENLGTQGLYKVFARMNGVDT